MTRLKLSLIVGSVVAVLLAVAAGGWVYYIMAPQPTVTLPGLSYSVAESDIDSLLNYSEARAVLERHVPGLTGLRQIDVARPLTLEDIQPYFPQMITDGRLAAIDAELRQLEGSNVVVYTTGSTLVGVILDDPEARDIVDSYLPGFSTHPDIGQGRGFTLNFMQKFDREAITDAKLEKINADFEALARKRAGLE